MKHCIIVKWNEKVTDKDLYYQKAKNAFAGVTDIPGVTSLRVYANCSERSNRADIMVEIECSQNGLENYDVSDLHRSWIKNYSEYIADKAIFDYE